MEKLKREFIELLEKDIEFRYTVAGYLGLSEILKRLDRLEEGQNKLWENQNRLWEEVRSLREGQNKLWEEVRALREGQNKLWENQNRLWEEVKALREGQNRLWEEVKALRVEYGRLRGYMISGFRDLRRALGVSFEEHAASFLEVMLQEMGYSKAKVEKKYLVEDGKVVEINMFCEDPLVVGEATTMVASAEDAENEVKKLLRRKELTERIYGKKTLMVILSVARAMPRAHEVLRTLSEKHGIKLILGKEIEEYLAV